jgi:ribonuclease R
VLSGSITADKVTKLSVFAEKSAKTSSENELRALYAERGIDDLYKTVYMADRIGETLNGVICSVTSFGFFVRTEDMCEGLVPISSLNGEFFFDEVNFTLASQSRIFRLGQSVTVSVTEADIISRKVTFTLISCNEAIVPKNKTVQKKEAPSHREYSKTKAKSSHSDRRTKERKYSKDHGKYKKGNRKKHR